MVRYDAGTTNPALLNRLGDWRDHEAWVNFVMLYDPVIRSISRRYRLDPDLTEELCQRDWIDLARRMCSFRYDPGKTFRGWLRRLCHSRAVDLLRKKKKASSVESLVDQPHPDDPSAGLDVDESKGSQRPVLLRQAEEVQDAVRRRVSEQTWQVFWKIAILGHSVRETSTAAGISYYAAFAAERRVGRMLREEGKRFLVEPRAIEPEVPLTGD